ncbi:MAG: AMMECR1 domain-containing protein, partial [Chloroflexi bacterium]|nr:AMMECR1 domain-containing protein [Chloroflexota bacterium]
LLLPDLDGVDTVDKQYSIVLNKAGLSPNEDVKIYRFEVERYE